MRNSGIEWDLFLDLEPKKRVVQVCHESVEWTGMDNFKLRSLGIQKNPCLRGNRAAAGQTARRHGRGPGAPQMRQTRPLALRARPRSLRRHPETQHYPVQQLRISLRLTPTPFSFSFFMIFPCIYTVCYFFPFNTNLVETKAHICSLPHRRVHMLWKRCIQCQIMLKPRFFDVRIRFLLNIIFS